MSKFSTRDFMDLANEIELAVNHKDRTISNVNNKKVKEYMKSKSKELIVSGVTNKVVSTAAGLVTYSNVAGALAPAITAPIFSSIAAAEAGAVIAGPIGSPIPIVGPIIAASVGVAIGFTTGAMLGSKQKKELKILIDDVMSKQNLVYLYIEKEALSIAQTLGEKANDNDRYIYLMAVIAANEELKKIKIK